MMMNGFDTMFAMYMCIMNMMNGFDTMLLCICVYEQGDEWF